MALTAVLVAQDRTIFADQRLGLGLDDGQGIAILARTVVAVPPAIPAAALEALATRPVFPGAVVPLTVVALTILTGALITGSIVTLPVFPGAIITVAGTVVAAAVVAVSIAVAVARTLVAIVALAVVTAIAGLGAVALAGVRFRRLRLGGRGGLGAALVLEIDVEARDELVATQNLTGRTLGLHGPHDAEIVFCVLKVVLGEDPVPGGAGVARQLLILFEDVLGVAANLHALGAVGVESTVGVLLLRLTAAAAAVATALTLHTLEISHS